MKLSLLIRQRLRPLIDRFSALPANDQRALLIMFAAIGATVCYFLLAGTRSYQQDAIEFYKDAREDHRWITLNMEQFKKLGVAAPAATAAAAASTDDSLIALATNTAKPLGIAFTRYQPEGDTGLRLWIEAGEFDKLLKWVEALDKQGIVLEQFDVDKLEKQFGQVDARVLVRRD